MMTEKDVSACVWGCHAAGAFPYYSFIPLHCPHHAHYLLAGS
jgi:hypothetical protein